MSAEMHDYAVALQKAIEAHCRGEVIVGDTAKECPHHAKKLNETLAERDQLKAANAELAESLTFCAAALRHALAVMPIDDPLLRKTEATEQAARAALTKHRGATV